MHIAITEIVGKNKNDVRLVGSVQRCQCRKQKGSWE
jgi:hypothetical protein